MDGETLKRIGTLGGAITVRKDMKNYYFGGSEPGGPFSKEKLFSAKGPLHPGMPNPETEEEALVMNTNVSDTKATLIRELTEQSPLTREEAELAVNRLIKAGKLVYTKVDGKRVLTFPD